MDYARLKADHLAQGVLFQDPHFKPNNNSIYLDGAPRSIRYGRGQIVWRRPHDIFPQLAPKFLIDGYSRSDLIQGAIGNCWFVAAAATLVTINRRQFNRVVPLDQSFSSGYAGIFHFHFWWYGDWVEICIDDYLPCDDHGIVFCQNVLSPNEFWPCLLEKAYAKLHGSYEALEGGKLHHALIDFTGGMTEVFSLQKPEMIPRDLFNIISDTYAMNTLMGAAIFRPLGSKQREIRRDNGLFMGHAYSITGVMSLQVSHSIVRLLRLRNPWGRGEWNGAWSDRSPEIVRMSPRDKQRLNLVSINDGEFWMAYDDFIKEFDELQMCHMVPDAFTAELNANMDKEEWDVAMFHGSWMHEDTACCTMCSTGIHWDNQQYYIGLKDPDSTGKCTLIVSLMEKEVRTSSLQEPEVLIGFSVFRLNEPSLNPLNRKNKSRADIVATAGEYEIYREICKRFELSPGIYVVIPQTYRSGDEADYFIRLYSKRMTTAGEMGLPKANMIVKSGNPHFVVKSSSRFDFDQGALGDCWFIAAAATLASSPQDNFRKVVPVNQSFDDGSYAGIFLFRFWSYGAWRDVVIDDYLPCNEAGLLYCRNREEPNEFWAALLEKAFAK